MLLINVEETLEDRFTPISRVTLALREHEAKELVEKITSLLKHPDYHHDHVEDYVNRSVLDLVVIQPSKIGSYSPGLQPLFQKLVDQDNE